MLIATPHSSFKARSIFTLAVHGVQIIFIALIQHMILAAIGYIQHTKKGALISYCCMVLTRYFFLVEFHLSCMNIWARFRVVNEHLEWLMTEKKFLSIGKNFPSKFGKVFGGLCDSIHVMNKNITFPFVVIFSHVLVYCIFAAYGFISELLKCSANLFTLYMYGFSLVTYFSYIALVCWQGDQLTSEAKFTLNLLSRIMTEYEFNEDQRNSYMFLSTQMRLRSFKVHNFLFNINWNIFLAVRNLINFKLKCLG